MQNVPEINWFDQFLRNITVTGGLVPGPAYFPELLDAELGQLGDHRGVDAAEVLLQADVFHDRAFQRRVAGALAHAKERRVEGIAAVEPRGGAEATAEGSVHGVFP